MTTNTPPPGNPADDAQRERILHALAQLRDTVLDIGASVEAHKGERCPYRTARDTCTHRGGCQNKVWRRGEEPLCGGDHKLQWEQDQTSGD